MEEILASIRRIIAEDEAGRSRAGAAPMPPRSTDSPSRAPRPRNGIPEAAPSQPVTVATPRAPQPDSGEMVLDLTNMVAADGSVVTLAPGFTPPPARSAPPQQPQGFAPSAGEQQTVSYSGFSRRPPPPGPGAEPRTPSYTPPPLPPMPSAPPPQPMGFSTTPPPESFSKTPRAPEPMPIPASLSEDSPSRRVFKRRHTAGSAFAELAQTGFAPAPPPPAAPAPEPNPNFGQVSMGAVATELDMSAPPPVSSSPPSRTPSPAPPAFASDPYAPPAFVAQPAPPPAPAPAFVAPPAPAPAPQFSEEQMRAAVGAAAEPVIRSWLDANLAQMVEQQLGTMVQQRVDQSVQATLPQAVDQRIHQNVEQNLGPYIEDRVGAHVDARLAAAVEEKVTAAVKQQVASAVNQQISQAVSQQVAAAVTQQLQGQAQNVSRIVDERVKSEIRGLFSRLAGN